MRMVRAKVRNIGTSWNTMEQREIKSRLQQIQTLINFVLCFANKVFFLAVGNLDGELFIACICNNNNCDLSTGTWDKNEDNRK